MGFQANFVSKRRNKIKISALYEQMKSVMPQKSKSVKNRSVDLFMGEEDEIDGIEVFGIQPEDVEEPESED